MPHVNARTLLVGDQRVFEAPSNTANDSYASDSEGSAVEIAESESSIDISDNPDSNEAIQQQLSRVSFGALAKAQGLLSGGGERKRKRGEDTNAEHESKLSAIRERLREIREQKGERQNTRAANSNQGKAKRKTQSGKPEANISTQRGDFLNNEDAESNAETDSASDSYASSDGLAIKKSKRSSKHAPTAIPANRAVSRYRDVVQITDVKSRDPRFDPTSGRLDRNAIKSRYSFLNDYQVDELASLKEALKKPKTGFTEDQRGKLQRQVVSMESKIAANKAREREEKVKREHKKKEKEAVTQGKKPFYLKKSEVKKQALVERFEGMKSRQKDKVIQRRRKKLAAKERRDMPMARRG
jgi:ribosomal RNA-processing protein 36